MKHLAQFMRYYSIKRAFNFAIMTQLSENWITEKHIDFEYKKYLLLAWLQKIDDDFKTIQLYPSLAELVTHYRNACLLRQNKSMLDEKFPLALVGVRPDQLKLVFEPVVKDDALMNEITRILDFSIPKFEEWLKEGKHIYEFIENEIEMYPVGIVPLRTSEGYLFLSQGKQDTRVYSFQMTIYDQPDSKWRALRTTHITDWKRTIVNSYESMKIELIRSHTELPNPAVYVAESDLAIPVEATFLPVAKRMLMKAISAE